MESIIHAIKYGLLMGLSFALAAGGTTLLAVAVSGPFYSFSSGEQLSAYKLNANFNSLRTAIEKTHEVPTGTIVAWHKHMPSATPVLLPAGWLECNGQTINDTESPYHNLVVPDLNGQWKSHHSKGLFLRGGSISGERQDDALQIHQHTLNNGTNVHRWVNLFNGNFGGVVGAADRNFNLSVGNPKNARTDSETRPANFSVVWIIKVK